MSRELQGRVFATALPRIIFVLGKGGVGRSTAAAALGVLLAERGERVLVLEWALADCIGPWFGAAPAGPNPVEIAPRLSVTNFELEEALRAYFVDHLHLGFVYRRIIRSRPVAQLLEVASGLAEMFFLGELWWLTTLAEKEAGLHFDRIVVDAPATGHGASLLDVPATLSGMRIAGLLETETRRVVDMMSDPLRTGAVVVSLPEPLVVDETLELVPRITERLGRPPLALVVNRSAEALASDAHPAWLAALSSQLSGPSKESPSPLPGERAGVRGQFAGSAAAFGSLYAELHARVAVERELRRSVSFPVLSIAELPGRTPLEVVREVARCLGETS
jgi:anion-transporting  ArsA/GET3 family ATPase